MNTDHLTDEVIEFLVDSKYDPKVDKSIYTFVCDECFCNRINKITNLFYNELLILNWKYIQNQVIELRKKKNIDA